MKKIVITSDAHGRVDLFDRVVMLESDADIFWDLGDNFCRDNPTKEFKDRWTFVQGNTDRYDAAVFINFEIYGKKIRIEHGDTLLCDYTIATLDQYMIKNDIDILCLGHTHNRYFSEEYGKYIINPGSLGRSRDKDCHENGLGSYAVLKLYEDGRVEVEFQLIKI